MRYRNRIIIAFALMLVARSGLAQDPSGFLVEAIRLETAGKSKDAPAANPVWLDTSSVNIALGILGGRALQASELAAIFPGRPVRFVSSQNDVIVRGTFSDLPGFSERVLKLDSARRDAAGKATAVWIRDNGVYVSVTAPRRDDKSPQLTVNTSVSSGTGQLGGTSANYRGALKDDKWTAVRLLARVY